MEKNKIIRTLLLVFAITFTFIQLVKADIPPDPGYTRVSISLEIETKEDVSDYKYFFKFVNNLKEVEIKSKGQTTIPPMGGGALYSTGTLWAIPKKSLANFGENTDELRKAIDEKKVVGAIELVRHGFSKTVPDAEAKNQTNSKYLLERDGEKGLKLITISEQTKAQTPLAAKTNESTPQSLADPTPSRWVSLSPTIFGGFIALAIILLGLWFFRKK